MLSEARLKNFFRDLDMFVWISGSPNLLTHTYFGMLGMSGQGPKKGLFGCVQLLNCPNILNFIGF